MMQKEESGRAFAKGLLLVALLSGAVMLYWTSREQSAVMPPVVKETKKAPPLKHAYVANQGDHSISQYTIGDDGALTPMLRSTVPSGPLPSDLAIHPSGKYLYAVNARCTTADCGEGSVSQYTIDPDGNLIPFSIFSVAAGQFAFRIALDPAGRYAYVANMRESTVSQYLIDTDGSLTPMTPPKVVTESSPIGITVDPAGRHLYVTNSNNDSIWQYEIGHQGALTFKASYATGSSPRAISFTPNGSNAYVANEMTETIWQFHAEVDGNLTNLFPATAPSWHRPGRMAVDPAGHNLYVANEGTLSQFAINEDGTLTYLSPPKLKDIYPSGFAFSPDGKHLYVTSFKTHNVFQFARTKEGGLIPITPPSVKARRGAIAIAITPRPAPAL